MLGAGVPGPFKCTDDALTVPVAGRHRRYAGAKAQAVHWRTTPAQTPPRALALGTLTVHWWDASVIRYSQMANGRPSRRALLLQPAIAVPDTQPLDPLKFA